MFRIDDLDKDAQDRAIGIAVIKLYCWQESIIAKRKASRKKKSKNKEAKVETNR